MREPIYKSRPVAPEAARFGRCERINDFISMSEGNSNVYLLETPEGNVQINSGMGFEAPVHRENLEQFSQAPVRYLVLTQGHVDHVGGVQYFRDHNPGLELVAQAGNPEHQEYDGRLSAFRGKRSSFAFTDVFAEVFADYAAHGYEKINGQDRPMPDVVFEERHELSLGGLDVVLLGCPGAETNDSLVVWLPQHRICLTGNLFGCPFGHFPNLITIRGDRYRDALVCADAAQTVLDLQPEMILYGHHAPVAGKELIQAELIAYRDAIHYVHDETVKGMNEGKDVHTLMREIALPPELEVGQGYGKVSWSVRAIWENYSGWFHHRSTTELYSVPSQAIHADLLELAGAPRLVERAWQKLEAGEREAALHLLDIVLSQEPDHEGAVEVALEVHRELLAESENFWLSHWLKNQIKLLEGGRTAVLSFR